MPTVLVTGGSGYLGQILIKALESQGHRVGYTYLTNEVAPGTFKNARGFKVDLSSDDGLDGVFQVLAPSAGRAATEPRANRARAPAWRAASLRRSTRQPPRRLRMRGRPGE